MPEYDNTNSGVLFRDTKRTNDKAPEYTGKLDVGGKEYRLAAWLKESKSGTKFFSLKISEPMVREPDSNAHSNATPSSDVPF